MTMEEAKNRAKNMSKVSMLKSVKRDLENRTWDQVDIIFSDGNRTGISNPSAINAAKKALLAELQRQMDEECWI